MLLSLVAAWRCSRVVVLHRMRSFKGWRVKIGIAWRDWREDPTETPDLQCELTTSVQLRLNMYAPNVASLLGGLYANHYSTFNQLVLPSGGNRFTLLSG
jgi:hypothetical protein